MIVIPSSKQKGENMYYGNQNPFERDSYDVIMCRDARKAFSRFHFGILAYIGSAYLISFFISIFLAIILGEAYITLTENYIFQWVMGVLPMYAIGLPLLYMIVRTMPKKSFVKSKMSLGEFISLFALSQFLMLVGNYIGTTVNAFFGAMLGEEITNSTSELIESSPVWLTLVIAVIIGPIIEELIFRKLMLDRLSRYGNVLAIFVSGISFGLFHGNLYQFFYSALLGILLAYITVKTGNWLYSVAMHVMINFFGSVAALPAIDRINEFYESLEAFESGAAIDIRSFMLGGMAVFSYVLFTYGVAIAGLIVLVLGIKNRRFRIRNDAHVNIPRDDSLDVAVFNVGTIIFIIVSLIFFALNIFLV